MSEKEMKQIDFMASELNKKMYSIKFLDNTFSNIDPVMYGECEEAMESISTMKKKISLILQEIQETETGLKELPIKIKKYNESVEVLKEAKQIVKQKLTPERIEEMTLEEIHAFIDKKDIGVFASYLKNAKDIIKDTKKILKIDTNTFAQIVDDQEKVDKKRGDMAFEITKMRKELETSYQALKALVDKAEPILDKTIGDKVEKYLEARDKRYGR